MAKQVYGVFGGEYSDWYCAGYFENAEDAYRYRDMRNGKDGYDANELYVIPIRKIECEFGKKEPLRFVYRIGMEKDGHGNCVAERVKRDAWQTESEPCVDVDVAKEKDRSHLRVNAYGQVMVTVVLDRYDVERAIEIAEEAAERYKLDIAEHQMDRDEIIEAFNHGGPPVNIGCYVQPIEVDEKSPEN